MPRSKDCPTFPGAPMTSAAPTVFSDLDIVEYPFRTAAGRQLKFNFPRGDIIGKVISMTSEWDYAYLTHFFSWAGGRGSFVEVGANIGSDTALACDYFRKCYSFEPAPRNRDLFTKNMELNGITNVQLFPFAVGDQVGKATLFLADCGGNALRQDNPTMKQTVEVDVTTLDAAIPVDGTDVSYIHIDTQGHDIKVLCGARQLLRRQKQKPIIRMEFQPLTLKAHGSKIEDLIGIIQEFKYTPSMNASFHAVPLNTRILADMFELWQCGDGWIDIFLLPPKIDQR
jgi:FkbM family methyltransferase